MTFAKNIAGLIDHVYGSIDISNDDIERLNEALVLKEGNELVQLKAIYGLFKSVNLLTMMLSVPSELSIIPPPLHGSCERRCQEKFSITAFP